MTDSNHLDARRPRWQRIGELFTAARVSLGAAIAAAGLLLFVVLSGPRYEALELDQDLELLEKYDLFEKLDEPVDERLSPEERTRVQEVVERLESLPPEEQRELREKIRRWRALLPEQRQELRRRWRAVK